MWKRVRFENFGGKVWRRRRKETTIEGTPWKLSSRLGELQIVSLNLYLSFILLMLVVCDLRESDCDNQAIKNVISVVLNLLGDPILVIIMILSLSAWRDV